VAPEVSDFEPAWFLRGPHLQTIWGRIVRPRRGMALRRETVVTPDGDELVLDHLDGDASLRFLLLHGLEGSSNSVYIQGLFNAIARHGFSATAINFRSCALDARGRWLPNRRPRFYHSGETGDFNFVARLFAAREPNGKRVAVGASLGGNVLLKWLGENPSQTLVAAAAAFSVPFDLGAGARHINPLYVARFLRSLKKKIARMLEHFPEMRGRIDLPATLRSRDFVEFDDAATAPIHGFASADDYYTRSSSLQFLPRITTPTLILNAEDDPFVPRESLERARAAASAAIDFRTTKHGGHTGFIGGRWPWRCEYWAEERIVEWLIAEVGSWHGVDALPAG
jgi:predicted alpha/beta-fold hydrolase